MGVVGGKKRVKEQKREDGEDARRGDVLLSHGKCKLCTKRTCVMYHFLPIVSSDCNGSIST